jgi:phosphoketolase
MAEKACHDIMRVEKFVDPQGHEVAAFSAVFGKDKDCFVLFKGRVALMRQLVGPNGQVGTSQPMNFEFDFPEGTGLKKAFETFDDVAKAAVEKFTKDQKEFAKANKVVGATAMPKLVGLNGKPL